MKLGKGVCQDYSHILIALCRKYKIPARYVVGMIIGEGATHAWVEVYYDGCWYGLDPTHNKEVDDYFIKIGGTPSYNDLKHHTIINSMFDLASDYIERQRLKAPKTIFGNLIALWDEAIWDEAYWQGEPRVSQDWTTISHYVGKAMSLRLKLTTKGQEVALVGFDLITQSGGMI